MAVEEEEEGTEGGVGRSGRCIGERETERGASKAGLDEALYGKAMVHREPHSRVPAESVLGTVGRGQAGSWRSWSPSRSEGG